MALIKDGIIATNHWRHLNDEEPLTPHQAISLSLFRWLSLDDNQRSAKGPWGVRLRPEDSLETLKGTLGQIDLVVLDMHPFTDGRSFTQARDLRIRFGYSGEIRARGDFLKDQIYFLHRLGVNAFEIDSDQNLEDYRSALNEFTVTYQTALQPEEALFRQRTRPSQPLENS